MSKVLYTLGFNQDFLWPA